MNFNRILTPAAVLATLSFAVTPAFAGQHSGGHSPSSSASRGSSRGSAARSAAPSRSYSVQSRSYGSAPRAASQSRRGGFARVAPRGFVSRGVFVAPSRFYRPYYTFRPRLSLGFGLWAGYPIAYSYPYYYGYPYPYDPYAYPAYYPPPAYSYPVPDPSSAYPPAAYPPANYPQSGQSGYYESEPPRGSVVAQPGTASGGISFEISPATAEVYIDGTYVGRVSELGPTTQPLALTPGRHHVEIRAAGYQTMVMDSDVTAGQVIPYQGTMQPAR